MKKLKNLIGAVVLLAAASLSFAASFDTAKLSGPKGLDDPPYISLTYPQTNNWPAGPITNGAQFIFTNVLISVYPDQGVGVMLSLAQQLSGAVLTTNVGTLYGDLSYDGGRTYTTTRPVSATVTPAGTNALNRIPIFIPYTNMAGAQILRITAYSNTVPAGALNHSKTFITNVVVGTRKPAQWGR